MKEGETSTMYLPMTSGETSSPGGDLGSLGLEQNVINIGPLQCHSPLVLLILHLCICPKLLNLYRLVHIIVPLILRYGGIS